METTARLFFAGCCVVAVPTAFFAGVLFLHALAEAYRDRRDRRLSLTVARQGDRIREQERTIARQRQTIADQHDQLRELTVQARVIESHLAGLVGRN